MPISPGNTLAERYRIVKLLSAGAAGAVYRAWDTRLNRACAIKEHRPAAAEAASFGERARRLAQAVHPHLPRLLDYFELDGPVQYLVAEFIDGEDLQSMQARGGNLQAAQLTAWIEEVCQALHCLHTQPIALFHGDIKPANIIIADSGAAFLVDIGAGASREGDSLATLAGPQFNDPFAAPEMYNLQAFDGRSDIYSLGATLYALLTGQEPLPAPKRMAGERLAEPSELCPELPTKLNQTLLRALDLQPEQRFATALDLGLALHNSQAGHAHTGEALIVALDGSGQYKSINQALASARAGAQIRVRAGVYRESLRLEQMVEIIGDGRVEEIVIESLQAECVSMAGEQALLRGLSLRGRAGSNGLKAYAVDIPRGRLVLEECDISNDSSACVAIHGPEADPVLRGCRIHHGSSGGVFAYRGGKGIIENCHIYANARPGIAIQQGANPLIRHTRITDGQQSGVYIYDGGLGKLEHCEVSGNGLAGIEIKQGGNPTIRNCRISANRYQAIYIHEGGLGRIENCDLSGNLRGAWRIDPDCQVERLSNRE